MFFKKQMFVLTFTTHTETELSVKKGRLHSLKKEKNQGLIETTLTSEKRKNELGDTTLSIV